MALSKHEQEMLDEMERRLYQSEADVVQSRAGRKLNLRSLVLGIVVGIVGIGVLLGGVTTQQLWLGVVGFVVMLGGVLLAFGRSQANPDASGGDSAKESAQKSRDRASLGDRMGQRWDQRMEGDR